MAKMTKIPRPLPPGVSAAFVGADGEVVYQLDPFLKDMKWPGLQIDSSAFKELPTHERLYGQSQAFLQAASILTENAGGAGAELKWPQASVCYYCLHLATELFLKACIFCLDRSPKRMNHEVADLLNRYRELLPDKEFYFPTPWFLSASDLSKIFGHDVLQGVDRAPDQLYRYGMDKKGEPSEGIQLFTPGYFLNYVRFLNTKWPEIWVRINKRMNS
jgi:hypothetical protein